MARIDYRLMFRDSSISQREWDWSTYYEGEFDVTGILVTQPWRIPRVLAKDIAKRHRLGRVWSVPIEMEQRTSPMGPLIRFHATCEKRNGELHEIDAIILGLEM